jgi:hypothetical protein
MWPAEATLDQAAEIHHQRCLTDDGLDPALIGHGVEAPVAGEAAHILVCQRLLLRRRQQRPHHAAQQHTSRVTVVVCREVLRRPSCAVSRTVFISDCCYANGGG